MRLNFTKLCKVTHFQCLKIAIDCHHRLFSAGVRDVKTFVGVIFMPECLWNEMRLLMFDSQWHWFVRHVI